MSKLNENYFKVSEDDNKYREIESILSEGERVLWRGKPKKSAFVWGRVLSMLPVALLWLLFDGAFIAVLCLFGGELPTPVIIGIAVFFLFHLLPVWIWISHIVTANRQHKNLEYAFTDKRIIIKSGIIGIESLGMRLK